MPNSVQIDEELRDQFGNPMSKVGQPSPTWDASVAGKVTITPNTDGALVTSIAGQSGVVNITSTRGATVSSISAITLQPVSLFRYVPGDSLALFTTKTRASSATYRDNNGIIQTAATDVMRDSHYIGAIGAGVRTLKLEMAATNLYTDFYLTGAGTGFTNTTHAASAVYGPNASGSTFMRKLSSNTTSSVQHAGFSHTESVGVGESVCFSVIAKYVDASARYMALRLSNPGNHVGFDLQTGVITTNSGGYYATIEPWGDGSYRCSICVSYAGAGSTTCDVRFGATDGNDSAVVPIGEGILITGYQVEKPSSGRLTSASMPIITTGATATRADDLCYRTDTIAVQSMSILDDYIDQKHWNGPSESALVIVGSTSMHGSNRYALGEAGANLYLSYRSGGTARSTSVSMNQSFNDRIRARATLASDGVLGGSYILNSGSETALTPQAALALPGAWDGQQYMLGYVAHRKVVVATGVKTMAELEAM